MVFNKDCKKSFKIWEYSVKNLNGSLRFGGWILKNSFKCDIFKSWWFFYLISGGF